MKRSVQDLLVPALAVVTLGSVAIAAAPVTWHLAGYNDVMLLQSAYQARAVLPAAKVDLDLILSLAPFGSAAPKSNAAVAADTPAGLILRGIFVAPGKASRALIAADGASAKLYSVGQTVPGGGVLEEILPGNVFIAMNGQHQTLGFPKKNSAPNGNNARPAVRGGVPGFATPVQSAEAQTKSPDPDEVIDRYRRQITENPQTVLNNLGVETTNRGYRIGQNMSADVGRAGLRPGDVILRVNGTEVGDVERDRQLFEQVASAGNARLEVMRDGRRLILTFPLR